MNENYAELITTFPLFKGFTANGTKRLIDAGEVKQHAAGQVLLKEGDSSDFVLLVLSGKLEVFVEREGKHLVLTDANPGTILGELAMLCGTPRSASVQAKENSTVLEWPDEAFRTLRQMIRSARSETIDIRARTWSAGLSEPSWTAGRTSRRSSGRSSSPRSTSRARSGSSAPTAPSSCTSGARRLRR